MVLTNVLTHIITKIKNMFELKTFQSTCAMGRRWGSGSSIEMWNMEQCNSNWKQNELDFIEHLQDESLKVIFRSLVFKISELEVGLRDCRLRSVFLNGEKS